jgi:carnitine 3-dehydrogenase
VPEPAVSDSVPSTPAAPQAQPVPGPTPAERPTRVGLLGGGVIGGGWAARFALNGVDVGLYDPDPDAPRKLEDMLSAARRAYGKLTILPLPREGQITFVDSPEEAAVGAEFVQESAPERVELKQRLLAAASAAAGPDVVICSSTSGLRPSLLQAEMTYPERLAVGHPFNPVYLLPLVELCGGERTAPETLRRARTVYRAVGMHPLEVRREIDGFLADRLLEALWREALWLVHDDVATVQEVDDAIRYGAGLRWAIMGTFLTYRMAGGEGGIEHFVDQFGPALELPWTKLVDVPELTPALVSKLTRQSDAQAAGQSVAELERTRDDCLVAVLQALRAQRAGAGETLATWERGLLASAPPAAGAAVDGGPPAPLRLLARDIPADWIDYNGHVTEFRYLELLADATDALLRHIGVDGAYLDAGGSYYTVESHICHLGQLYAGDRVAALTQILGWDDRRLHLFHAIVRDGDDGHPVATGEHLLLHVDVAAERASAVRDGVRERLAAVAEIHAALPRPQRAGRRISI